MTAPNTRLSEFQALKKLINTNLDKYEELLKENELSEPFVNEARLHPQFDHPGFLPGKELYGTTRDLVSALDMMAACVQSPAERIMSESMAVHRANALQIACRLNLADVIRELGGKDGRSVSVDRISEKTGVDVPRLMKVLRPLANNYIFQETSEGHFTNNRTSLMIAQNCDVKAFVEWQSWFTVKVAPFVPKVFIDSPKLKNNYDPAYTAAMHAFDAEGKFPHPFLMLQDYDPARVAQFGAAMQACNRVTLEGVLLDYPWAELPEGTTCVDVGGGIGAVTMSLLKRYPNLKGVVQDLPDTVELAKKNFEEQTPQDVASGRVQFDATDFFKSQPRSGDKTVYLLRYIMHDWPDHLAEQILKNIEASMQKDSRIVILDLLVQPAVNTMDEDTVQGMSNVPYPLYRSGGITGDLTQRLDQEMMNATNATERTPRQFRQLIERAGLRVESMMQPRSLLGIVTAVLP